MLNKHSNICGNKLLKITPLSERIFICLKVKQGREQQQIKKSDVAPGKTILIQCKEIFEGIWTSGYSSEEHVQEVYHIQHKF